MKGYRQSALESAAVANFDQRLRSTGARELFRVCAALMLVLTLISASFSAQGAEPLCSSDIDGNGSAEAGTDGLLLVRHLFGFAGDALTADAVGTGCSRCTGEAIASHLETPACQVLFDIDGDGRRRALTDGLLFWRERSGLSGAELIAGALGEGAVRTDPESLRGWLALGVMPAGEAPWRVELVGGSSLVGDQIELEWLTTVDNDTPVDELRYVLHAHTDSGYVPSPSTANTEVIDQPFGTLTDLTPNTLYYVTVEAVDALGNNSWSNALAVRTATTAPNETSAARMVLDETNTSGLTTTADSVSYTLPVGASVPAVGDIITSSIGRGFLRRVTNLSVSGDQVTLQTEPADLVSLFDAVQLSNDVKLIDVPEQQSLSGAAATRQLSVSQSADERRIRWPERGLTISQRPLPTTLGIQKAASTSNTCDGSAPASELETDAPLEVRFPKAVCIEPGTAGRIEVDVAIDADEQANYQITDLYFERLDHPSISKWRPNYGATWEQPDGDDDVEGIGILSWLPDDHHIDDQGQPFTAHFVARAKERAQRCTAVWDWCRTKKVKFEVDIYVNWGEIPGKTQQSFSSSGSQLTLSGEAGVDFQPTVTAEADIDGTRLDYAVVRLDGPLAFTTEVRLQASAYGRYGFDQPLLDKRFVKVLWAGQVPIIINGRLQLEAQFRAEADAALDVSQELALGYDITAGLEYDRDGGWRLLREATPWQRYELRGEADTRAYVELRFVPDLEVEFYDMAGGRFVVEPYLYGEAALEGHFVYRDATGGSGSDADYRFTQLAFGGGIDAGYRLGLEVFNVQLAGYPSRDPDELERFALLDRTPILGLPQLAPFTEGTLRRDDGSCAIGLAANVTPVPNPFQGLVGGPDTFNAFVDDSAAWQAVLPASSVQLTPGTEPTKAWFSADAAGQYTLRLSGHSDLGSFIRQYEQIQVSYDPAALDCPGAGKPWISPGSGSWIATPQWLQMGSDGAETLYYRMHNTYDGSDPGDPGTPSPAVNDGWVAGPVSDFELYNEQPGTLKRSKLRVVGCSAGGCGPVSDLYEYRIDLRGGASVGVAPSSGSWSVSPQGVALSSAGADSIYYTMVNTYDGSSPTDPPAPSPSSFDGVKAGPDDTFTLYGSSGQLKRSKLRFVGCAGSSCGPVSGVYEYRIDLRGGTGVQPGTYPLNDTGIDWCANGSSNFLSCPVAGYPWQDAQDGRDAHQHDDSDGHAGFSFTKLDANGNPLSAGAGSWSCVRDNVTGLVWEVKTNDGGLHDKDDEYNWYNTDPSTNGGFAGYADDDGAICFGYDSGDPSTYCNTQAYVARVNDRGLCGARDWRLPSVDELLSIVSNDRYSPAIGSDYFPNAVSSSFWSSSPGAGDSGGAWGVDFSNGSVDYLGKSNDGYVRLVRAGQ